MALLRIVFGIVWLLGAVGFFIAAPIRKRAGKTEYFWVMLVFGVLLLIMAIYNL
jgi:hypothetical protein